MSNDLDYLIGRRLPLIRIRNNDKAAIEKNWSKTEHRDRPAEFFKGYNVAVKCGSSLNGDAKRLYVLDIDPRNGGSQTYQKWVAEKKQIPDTVTVRTPSGGYHYWLYSERELKKTSLKDRNGKVLGVDFQGVGSYVLCPPSAVEGKPYEFLAKHPVAPMPEWLREEIFGDEDVYFDANRWAPKESILRKEFYYEGERNNCLYAKGRSLRRSGFSMEEIRLILPILNETRCKPPLQGSRRDKELEGIARSIEANYDPGKDINNFEIELPSEISHEKEKNIVTPEYVKEIKDIFNTGCAGLVKTLADKIYVSSIFPYEHFALASSLAIISGCAQGGHSLTPITNEKVYAKGGLNLYQWLLAPSGAGKDHYLQSVNNILAGVDERLVSPKFGSVQGLRQSFYQFNSRVSCIDEMQDEFRKLTAQPGSYLEQILTEMKELSNNPNALYGTVLKDKSYPKINFPRYSLFSVGTTSGYLKYLNGNLIEDGLLSRFVIWPEFPISKRHSEGEIELSASEKGHLRDLFEIGLLDNSADTNEWWYEAPKKFNEAVAPSHEIQTDPKKFIIGYEKEARNKLLSFTMARDSLHRKMANDRKSEANLSPGSVMSRSSQFAIKFSAIHAIGRRAHKIDTIDAEFGVRLALVLSNCLATQIDDNAADSQIEKWEKLIFRSIKKFEKPVIKRTLTQ